MGKHYIIPIFVPHLGCPHDCVFCNQRKIAGDNFPINREYVREKMDAYLESFKSPEKIEVAFYGGSFTGIDLDLQKDLLYYPKEYKSMGKIDGIRLSTRPDYIDQEIIDMLLTYGVDTIELGVQSSSDLVLEKSGRGHTSKDFLKASKIIKDNNINLGLQMMLGLPGDSLEKALKTAEDFIKLEPYCVRIYPTLVIRDTYLEKLYVNGDYKPLSLEDSIEQAGQILTLFNKHSINVIRVGLQPTDNIQLGKDVVAGPFHPSFRQLVESYLYRRILDDFFSTLDFKLGGEEVTIFCSNKNVSEISGQKSLNKKYLKDRYGLKEIRLMADKDRENLVIGLKCKLYSISIEEAFEELYSSE